MRRRITFRRSSQPTSRLKRSKTHIRMRLPPVLLLTLPSRLVTLPKLPFQKRRDASSSIPNMAFVWGIQRNWRQSTSALERFCMKSVRDGWVRSSPEARSFRISSIFTTRRASRFSTDRSTVGCSSTRDAN